MNALVNGAPAISRGFTLLEVLIALVVLSIGLLGLAALQTVGLRGTHGANLVSQAALLAYDMADRIRANPDESAYDDYTTECPDVVPTAPLVQADLAEWSCMVGNLLPAGSGRITMTQNGSATRYTITVEWEDTQVGEDEGPWDFTLAVDL